MDELTHRVSAWDGLTLHVREWRARGWPGREGRGGDQRLPLLCLPGLVRTGADFASLAAVFGRGRRVVAPDYMGRGRSDWTSDLARYSPEACLRDIADICMALDLPHVIAIGTSFGGLLAMGLAAARPMLLRGVVLNDVGPEVGAGGSDFVRRFVAHDPALPDLDACVNYLRERLPP